MRIGITLPIMLPGLLIGISLLVLLTTVLDLSLSRRTAVIGQSIFTTPFVILLAERAPSGPLDRRIEWAASDLGADPIRRLRHVVLPALPGRAGSAVLAFTLSFDEFIITLFLIGGDQTLPLYIFTHVRYGITPAVNAVASLFLARVVRGPLAGVRVRVDRPAAEALLEPACSEGDQVDRSNR